MLALLIGLALAGPAAEAEVYEVRPAESQVHIELRRAGLLKFLGHDHRIEAPLRGGRVSLRPDAPAASQVWLRWDAAALRVVPESEPAQDIPEVEERMQSPDVLDAMTHPQIIFVSDRVSGQRDGDGGWALRVLGSIRIRGGAHAVAIPVSVRVEGDRLVASGTAELELRGLGVDPPSVAGVVKVADGFRVAFEVVAVRLR